MVGCVRLKPAFLGALRQTLVLALGSKIEQQRFGVRPEQLEKVYAVHCTISMTRTPPKTNRIGS